MTAILRGAVVPTRWVDLRTRPIYQGHQEKLSEIGQYSWSLIWEHLNRKKNGLRFGQSEIMFIFAPKYV